MSVTVPERDWWYVRVYPGGPRLMDAAVRTLVPWLAEQAGRLGSEDWFFIRYWDATGHHLRLRLRAGTDAVDALHGTAREELTGLLDTLEERPEDAVGLLPGALPPGAPTRGVTPALYAPELAKYGGPDGVAVAERVFHLDSAFSAGLDLSALPRRYERAAHAVHFARALTSRVLTEEERDVFWVRHRTRWGWQLRMAAAGEQLRPLLGEISAGVREQGVPVPGVRERVDAHADALAELVLRAPGSRDHQLLHHLHMVMNRLGFQPGEEAALGMLSGQTARKPAAVAGAVPA
ncbi:lantibiotic dehydratase C-terminal domain-containing protein [Streptomyces sp. P9(2023)]|uniref:lantibiotic dehydratase C-terminal domain-containing protein n=1 Tax=Streptomyces sp. P9(2023) TaxID=3064394 RepID=UPI0028F43499|nr:lantibiotic dehydratase C-terminal domain-containing protein [Streptomyces sp. P9(2023)]MDT9689118.1 lantibiotic dehydratase C-terminal domain-containing protein [Streptomyces sp. P9(2023)]